MQRGSPNPELWRYLVNEPRTGATRRELTIMSDALDREETQRPLPNTAQSRWKVLVLLFVGIGPLAIPVLLASPRFSRLWKGLLLVLVLLQTALVIWIAWVFIQWFVQQMAPVWG